MTTEFKFAKDTANITTPDGGRHLVRKGEHWEASDPVVQAAETQSPGLFTDDHRYGVKYSAPPKWLSPEPPVEQATAGPGERRAQVKPRG
jgi:hypothetical protein